MRSGSCLKKMDVHDWLRRNPGELMTKRDIFFDMPMEGATEGRKEGRKEGG